MKPLLYLFSTAMFLLFFSQIAAQSEIVTDRPDQTESAKVVPKGAFQLETGILLEIDRSTFVSTHNFQLLNNLFRYGLHHRIELRIVSSLGHTSVSPSGWTVSDLEAGLKLQLFDGPIRAALLGHAIFPTATSLETGLPHEEDVGMEFLGRLLFDFSVSEKINWGVNGVLEIDDKGKFYPGFTNSLGFSLTDKLGVFLEIYGETVADILDEKAFDLYYDNGLTYLWKPNLQLDFSFGLRVTGNRYNFYSAGLSWRIPRQEEN